MNKQFVNLHAHSHYSILDGYAKIDEYVDKAKNRGDIGVGLTDHGTMAGIYEFITKANAAGLKPVPGLEAYVAPENPEGAKVQHAVFYGPEGKKAPNHDVSGNGAYLHLTLFAYNNAGLHNLIKLSSLSWQKENFYAKPRIDTKMLFKYHEGLIVTTGCPSSEISTRFLLGQDDKAYEYASRLHEVFGDNMYVEIMDHHMKDDMERFLLKKQRKLAKDLGIPLLATNDSHYANKEDAVPHERMLCMQSGNVMSEPSFNEGGKRFAFTGPEYYMKSDEEMRELFPEDLYPGAVDNTVKVVEQCEEIQLEYNPHLRPIPPLPEGETEVSYLKKLINKGFKAKRGNEPKAIQQESLNRIKEEFEVINSNDFAGYFLIVNDYIQWSHDHGITTGAGRGSVGGSEIAYVMDIGDTDPIRFDLLFERFLSPGRGAMYQINYTDGTSEEANTGDKREVVNSDKDIEKYVHELNPGERVEHDGKVKEIKSLEVIRPGSAPDIDTDFHTEGREKAVQHVVDTYGRLNVSNIITFGTFKAKNSLKSMATIYQIPFAESNKVAQLIPKPIDGKECSLDDIYNPDSPRYAEAEDFRRAVDNDRWREVIKMARPLSGRIRETGIHACGIVISSNPIEDTVPTQVRQNDGTLMTQWTYPACESLGLIKMDFLGLDTLDIIDNTLKNIKVEGKKVPDMSALIRGKMDDKKTYKLLQNAETTGIFQLGSPGMRDLLKRVKPTEFEDLAAVTALYRPGPMKMNSHIQYADRKNGREKISYIDDEFAGGPVEDVLKKTYGLCVPAGTPIFDSTKNAYVPIENLTPNVSSTPSINIKTNKVESKTIKNVIHTGKKDSIKLTFNTNQSIIVSRTHPLLTSTGWKNAGDIELKDNVGINSTEYSGCNINNSLTADEAWAVGAMLGNGTIEYSQFTSVDEEVMDNLTRIVLSRFDNMRAQKIYSNNGVCTLRFRKENVTSRNYHNKNNFNLWLNSIGLNNEDKLDKKQLPIELINKNDNVILSNLIAGLWDTDGMISESGISFTTTSSSLFYGVKIILRRLGVPYSVNVTPYENKTRANKTAYRICPEEKSFMERIYSYMVLSRRKNAKLREVKTHDVYTLSNEYFYKNVLTYLQDNFNEKNEKDEKYLTHKGLLAYNRNGKIGYKALCSILETKYGVIINNNKNKFINTVREHKLVPSSVLAVADRKYVRVVNIESVGEKDCYDIEVADNHNFFINEIIAHNCIYQESCMQLATHAAGMSSYESDKLRKAIGKKKMKIMMQLRPKFIEGIENNGYSKKAADELWDTVQQFGQYGFNKSHSVSYGINAYKTCYLKANYPAEFMSALIQQNTGDPKKIMMFLQEAKRMGLRVGPVDVNDSQAFVAPAKDKTKFDIIYGFSGIKQVSDDLSNRIIKERESGKYKSPADFVERVTKCTTMNSQALKNLALSGAFDKMNVSRRAIVEKASALLTTAKSANTQQRSLFDLIPKSNTSMMASIDLSAKEYPYNELIKLEADCIGIYVSGSPTAHLGSLAHVFSPTKIKDIQSGNANGVVNVLGSFTMMDAKTKKNGNRSVAVRIDDGSGFFDVYLPNQLVNSIDKGEEIIRRRKLQAAGKSLKMGTSKRAIKLQELIDDESVVPVSPITLNEPFIIQVKIMRKQDSVRLLVNKFKKIATSYDGSIPFDIAIPTNINANIVANYLNKHKGDTYVRAFIKNNGWKFFNQRVSLSQEFIEGLENIIGGQNILTKGA